MKKKGIILFVLVAAIVLLILIPIVLHSKIEVHKVSSDIFVPDYLDYIASLIIVLPTIYLGYIACKQSDRANETNERLLCLELDRRKSYVKIDNYSSRYDKNNNMCTLLFQPLSDIPIINFKVCGVEELHLATEIVKKQDGTCISIDESKSKQFSVGKLETSFFLDDRPLREAFTIILVVELFDIMNHKAKQGFRIYMLGSQIECTETILID